VDDGFPILKGVAGLLACLVVGRSHALGTPLQRGGVVAQIPRDCLWIVWSLVVDLLRGQRGGLSGFPPFADSGPDEENQAGRFRPLESRSLTDQVIEIPGIGGHCEECRARSKRENNR
jgi:hypothetical protein